MQTATIEDVQARLPQILEALAPGEEVVIMKDGKPVGQLSRQTEVPKGIPVFGRGKGSVLYMAPDFDAPVEEFKEYME